MEIEGIKTPGKPKVSNSQRFDCLHRGNADWLRESKPCAGPEPGNKTPSKKMLQKRRAWTLALAHLALNLVELLNFSKYGISQ